MRKVGVFICQCGTNIAGTIDCESVARHLQSYPGVVLAGTYTYYCSEPGQTQIQEAIRQFELEAVVVAACSPRMHEKTFRKALEGAGLNPYLLVMVNLREQCSWVHPQGTATTAKAVDLVKAGVEKARWLRPLTPVSLPIKRRALIIGGGIAGIQAALDLAQAQIPVTLVEREPSIGGRMASLDKTFPTLDCSACILSPKMVEVANHPGIELLTSSEVVSVKGCVGNFQVEIQEKPRYIRSDRCTGCGECYQRCPGKVKGPLGQRAAISLPFPQAIPNRPIIDPEACLYLQKGGCRICARVCGPGAIDFDQSERIHQRDVGAIIVSTGTQISDGRRYAEYSVGRSPDILTQWELEQMLNSSGPTQGSLIRPSDGQVPQTVVFVQCVGSRDAQRGQSYCSKVCCMISLKQALQVRERLPHARVMVFAMDIRASGKGYEEFYHSSLEKKIQILKGRVGRIYPRGGRLIVRGEDTLLGEKLEIGADLVILATAHQPALGAAKLAQTLAISYDTHGFFTESHPKLQPVESPTAGVFLAGACLGPKDISESVAQASAAAAKALLLLARKAWVGEAEVAQIDPERCNGCFSCQRVCPSGAILEKEGRAYVQPGLCSGCGQCAAACPSGALDLEGYTDRGILAEVDALCP